MVPMYIYLENLENRLNTMTESLLPKEIASWDCRWTSMLWRKVYFILGYF